MSAKKIFPFAPKVRWSVYNKLILPKLDTNSYNRLVEDRDIVLLCFGGALEVFYASVTLENLRYRGYKNKFYYKVSNNLRPILEAQGLANEFEYDINHEFCHNYPVPLFIDNSNHCYINSLNNYIKHYNYNGDYLKTSRDGLVTQISKISLINWDIKKPKFRVDSILFDRWCRANNFDYNKPYFLIIPDITHNSMHSINVLGWSIQKIKELIALGRDYINFVICTNKQEVYRGCGAYIANNDIMTILNFMQHSKYLMSREIDNIFIGASYDNYLIYKQPGYRKQYQVHKLLSFLGAEIEYLEANDILVEEVISLIKDRV